MAEELERSGTSIPLYSDIKSELSNLSEDVIDKLVLDKKSIADFDYKDIRKLDSNITRNITDIDLLKILLVRGVDKYNPALKSGADHLLRQLNGERIGQKKQFQPSNNDKKYVRNFKKNFNQ